MNLEYWERCPDCGCYIEALTEDQAGYLMLQHREIYHDFEIKLKRIK